MELGTSVITLSLGRSDHFKHWRTGVHAGAKYNKDTELIKRQKSYIFGMFARSELGDKVGVIFQTV